jgi:hypothetical protein
VPILAGITQHKIFEEIFNHGKEIDYTATFNIGGSVPIDHGDSNEIMGHGLKAPEITSLRPSEAGNARLLEGMR